MRALPYPTTTSLVAAYETYMRSWVFFRVTLRSSKVSSISCLFWISERFCSSSSVKMSRSCLGSVKYSSSSCNQRHVCKGPAVEGNPGYHKPSPEWRH